MALKEKQEIGIIEIVNNHVQVRMDTIIERDGKEISRSHHRHVIAPGQDYSKEPAEVQAICKAVHTKSVVDAYKAKLAQPEELDGTA